MIRINLSPKKIEKRKENVRLQIWIFVLVLTVILAGCYIAYNQRVSKVRDLQTRVDQKQKAVADLQVVNMQLHKIQEQEKDLANKRNIIKGIIAQRDLAFNILVELSKTLLPDSVWLTSAEGDMAGVTIDGYALDNQTIAAYMTKLEQSSLFSNVDLNRSEQTSLTGIRKRIKEIKDKEEQRLGRQGARGGAGSKGGPGQPDEQTVSEIKLQKFQIVMRVQP